MHPGSISKWIKEDCGQPSPRTASRDIPVGNYARCAKSFTNHVRKVLMVGTDYYVGSHPHWPERGCVVLRSDPGIGCKLMEPERSAHRIHDRLHSGRTLKHSREGSALPREPGPERERFLSVQLRAPQLHPRGKSSEVRRKEQVWPHLRRDE